MLFVTEFQDERITIGPISVVSIKSSRLKPSSPTRYLTSIVSSIGEPSVTNCGNAELVMSKFISRGRDSKKVADVARNDVHLTAGPSFINRMARTPSRGK